MIFLIWLLVVIATEAITEIIVNSEIFSGLRKFLSKSNFFGTLVNCGYCMSVWVALGTIWVLPKLFEIVLFDIIIKVFVIHRLSNLWHELIRRWLDRYPLTLVVHKIGDSNEKRRK